MASTAYPRHHAGPPPTCIQVAAVPQLFRASVFPIAINRPSSIFTSTLSPDLQRRVTVELSGVGAPYKHISDGLGRWCVLGRWCFPICLGKHMALVGLLILHLTRHIHASMPTFSTFLFVLLWQLRHSSLLNMCKYCFPQAKSHQFLGSLPEYCILCLKKVLSSQ